MRSNMEYKLGKVPLAGTVLKGTITSVEEGIVKQFVENTEKWGNPEAKCVNLTISSESGKTFSRIFTLGVNEQGEIFPNSNLGKFFLRYGTFPKIDTAVSLVVNAQGWLDLLI